jgi:hypothetical protein
LAGDIVDLLPTLKYCHCSIKNPLEEQLAAVLRKQNKIIKALRNERYARSQDVERELEADLLALGFTRSATVNTVAELFAPGSDFEIDFFNPALGIGVEVEKGRHFSVWRNLVKFCESPLVRHGVLVIPHEKQGSQGTDKVLSNTIASLDNVQYLYRSLDSLLCYGY